MYIVTMQGVYLQDVLGPFHTLRQTKKAAQRLAESDGDAYHEWQVRKLSRIGLRENASPPLAAYDKTGVERCVADLLEQIERFVLDARPIPVAVPADPRWHARDRLSLSELEAWRAELAWRASRAA